MTKTTDLSITDLIRILPYSWEYRSLVLEPKSLKRIHQLEALLEERQGIFFDTDNAATWVPWSEIKTDAL